LALLLQDKNLRNQLGRQAVQVAQDYAWEKITARLVNVYEEVLDKRERNRIGRNTESEAV
jgi:glycosyltransferase involved in cell wall biosynthesis